MIVTGPTASGKSAVALSLAEKTGGVIINADSQQIYRDLRVLTARPTPEEETRAPHRLYGLLPADENCSAGKWLNLARMEIDWALSQNKTPIVTGGTGLYLKALLEGIAEIPDVTPEIREQAINDYDIMGKEAFSRRLRDIDPGFFARLKIHDRQRLIRAYAVWLGTGKPLTFWQQKGQAAPYPGNRFDIYNIDISRELLYERCNRRFDAMLEAGALNEVKLLLSMNISNNLSIMKSVGVKELGACLRGEISLETAVDKAKQATRNYAKRQLTWFRNQLPQARIITGGEL